MKQTPVRQTPVLVEADGELVGLTPVEVEIYPGAFQVAAEKLRVP